MDQKAKLVEVERAAEWFEKRAENTPMPMARKMFKLAGEALREKANGVTVQEWISVKDRLPIEEVKKYRGETGEDPEFNVMIKGGLVPTSLFFNGEYWYCNFDASYAVTHWAPLPSTPKED